MTDSLLDHPLIAERYFFPRKAHFENPFRVRCGDAELCCFLQDRRPGARTVVHFHGNGEIVPDYFGDFLEAIDALECNCLLVEFRGYGMSTGTPLLGRMLDDVAVVVRALGKPSDSLVFFGRSVGSIHAIHAASLFPDAAGLILESGIASPLERLLMRIRPEEMGASLDALRKEARARLDHETKLARFRGPVLILHTLDDGLVDVGNARTLNAWCAGRATLKIFEHGDHNSILFVNRREYFAAVAEFLS
jgi:pimeloyl-ACP methyl ester carboxylesterase